VCGLLGAAATQVAAAEIKVLSAVPLYPGVSQLAEQYKRASGQDIVVQSVTTGDINRILSSNEPFDILITTTALVDQAAKDGRAVASTKTGVGRVGIGVIVRRNGATVPSIATADALKQAVLAAEAVVYNTAGSGQYIHSMFEKMGVTSQIQSKTTRPSNAAQTMGRIIEGKGNDIGFGLISEIKPYEEKGVRFVGPLPPELQGYTNYEAVISTRSSAADPARAFIRFLTTPAAKEVLSRTGVD
jgi:molybdate transport system substrate-binding protein